MIMESSVTQLTLESLNVKLLSKDHIRVEELAMKVL